MHILQVYQSPVPVKLYGGMERVIESLCTGFVALGHKVSLLSYRGDYEIPGINHLYMDGHSPQETVRPEVLLQLIPENVDIVHFHLPFKFDHFPFPHLATMHGNLGEHEDLSLLPDHLVFLTEDHAHRHGRKDFVFNGLDPSQIGLGHKSLYEREYFAFLGRASLKRKGLHLAKQIAKHFSTPLRIGGGRGISFGLSKYLGQLDNSQKFQLLQEAKALLFPILWDEPFGLVMIEAMFCGTPVFALRRGSVAQVLGLPGHEGLFLHEPTLDELISSIGRFSCQQISPEQIRAYAEEYFTHLKMCESYLKYYQKILSPQ